MNRTIKVTNPAAADSLADKMPGHAAGEKSARRSPPYRTAGGALLLLLILLLSVTLASCVRVVGGDVANVRVSDPEGGDDYILKEIQMDSAYFQGVGSVPLQPSLSYWLKKGDKMAFKWDTFEFHWERDGVTCDFPDNNSGTDCQVCDYCHPPSIFTGLPCLGAYSPVINRGDLTLVADSTFTQSDNPTTLFDFEQAGSLAGACSNSTVWPVPTISPEASGLYRIKSNLLNVLVKGPAEGRAKVHVLSDGEPSKVTAFQASERREAAHPTKVWYQWSTNGDQLWEDNFSPNLRVTKVRILKGRPSMDVNTGRFKLDDVTVTPIRPSRIFLTPAFDPTQSALANDNLRCFAAPSTVSTDGDIDLTSCRQDPLVNCPPNGPNCLISATPTYLLIESGSKLTWFAEFNPCEGCASGCTPSACPTGATAPTLQDGEVLAIEFTIQIA